LNKNEYEKEIDFLIGDMTLEEKVDMLHAEGPFNTGGVKRLDVPPLMMDDGPMGVRCEFKPHKWEPLGCSYDFVTYLPSNMALASTWNTELAYRMGTVLGREARGRGKDVILAPGINIIRSLLCGRNFEYMSEDPCLISRLAVPFIKGIQEQDVAACVKHFAMNNQEYNRLTVNVEADERTLREIYLPGFKAAVCEANCHTIMSAYNKFRGTFCSHNSYLLKDILRDEWNFKGIVISDWGAVHDTLAPAENGLDIEMSTDDKYDEYYFAEKLIELVKKGKIKESVLDEKIRNILRLMFTLKMFGDNPRSKGAYNTAENREETLNIARESVVLLKNKTSVLPLNIEKTKKLTVIGENAERKHSDGGGSARVKSLYEAGPLMGLKMLLGGNSDIEYFRGYSENESESEELLNEAVDAAESAQQVVLFVGLNHDYDTEGRDRKDMYLPYRQDELIKRVLEANKNTVVVIFSGSPVDMNAWIDKADTLVQCWYCGMEGGYALAETLFGLVNPSGRLPITMPVIYEDTPVVKMGEYPGDSDVHYNDGLYVGYRYYDAFDIKPQFCFGHGLSYTNFNYTNLKVVVSEGADDVAVKVTADVSNTGERVGAEVVQLYIADYESTLIRPSKELKGFKKLFLQPGETKTIEIDLDKNAFSFYDSSQKTWVCEKGCFDIKIGGSSRDIRLTKNITIKDTIKYTT
jgi:beta-glucosidase